MKASRPLFLKFFGARGEGILGVARRLGWAGASADSTDLEAANAVATYEAGLVGEGVIVDAVAARDAAHEYRDEAETFSDEAQAAAAQAGAAIWVRPFLDRLKSPPGSPALGDRYVVHHYGTTGAFVGKENQGAEWTADGWAWTGVPKIGQVITMRRISYIWNWGVYGEDTIHSTGPFWRPFNPKKVVIPRGAHIYAFGDSITVGHGAGQDYLDRVAEKWNLDPAYTNDAVSGKGCWTSAWKAFARPTARKTTGNKAYLWNAGHNNAVYAVDADQVASQCYNEFLAFLCHIWSRVYTPASAMAATGTWLPNTADGLGIKDKAYLSGAGLTEYSYVPGSKLTSAFSNDMVAIHLFQGDAVSQNQSADIKITIDGNLRGTYHDPNDYEYQSFEGTHMGHTIWIEDTHGLGNHTLELEVGADAGGSRPAYVDGFTDILPPQVCDPFILVLPLRPWNFAGVGPGTNSESTYQKIEDAFVKALSWFPDHPWAIAYVNDWLDNPGLFDDGEHPSTPGHIWFERSVSQVIEQGEFDFTGSYTPVASNLTNLDSAVPSVASWSRKGNVVTVSGRITLNATADNLDTGVELTLPFASNLANSEDISGTAATYTARQQSAAVLGNTSTDHAWFLYFNTAGTGDVTFAYTFQYIVSPGV